MSESREWTLADARARVRELEKAAQELVSTVYALELAKQRCAELQRELDASHRREALLVAELHEAKRQGDAGFSTRPNNVTPLRPGPRSKR